MASRTSQNTPSVSALRSSPGPRGGRRNRPTPRLPVRCARAATNVHQRDAPTSKGAQVVGLPNDGSLETTATSADSSSHPTRSARPTRDVSGDDQGRAATRGPIVIDLVSRHQSAAPTLAGVILPRLRSLSTIFFARFFRGRFCGVPRSLRPIQQRARRRAEKKPLAGGPHQRLHATPCAKVSRDKPRWVYRETTGHVTPRCSVRCCFGFCAGRPAPRASLTYSARLAPSESIGCIDRCSPLPFSPQTTASKWLAAKYTPVDSNH